MVSWVSLNLRTCVQSPEFTRCKESWPLTPVLWHSPVCHGMCPQSTSTSTVTHSYIHIYNTIVKVKIMFLIKAVFAWKHSECQQTAGMCLQLWSAVQLMDPLLYISCIRDGWRWKPGQSPSTSNLHWGLVLFRSSVCLCPVFCDGPWTLGRVCVTKLPHWWLST